MAKNQGHVCTAASVDSIKLTEAWCEPFSVSVFNEYLSKVPKPFLEYA